MMAKTKQNELANPSARAWCWTLANPSFQEIQELAEKFSNPNYDVEKIIAGQEIGEGGLQHIQGYLVLGTKTTLWQIRRRFSERAHWETAKAGPQQNYEYCTKQGKTIFSKGFEKQEKKVETKNYWGEIIRDAMTMNVGQFMIAHPKEWLIRRAQIERLMLDSAKAKMRTWGGILTNKNFWIWGRAGLGKSRWANGLNVPGDCYRKNYNKWWCGFDSRTVQKVIVEDWPGGQQGEMLAQHCKIWGDRYPFVGETKGSAVMIEPGAFFLIITSNFSPAQCFSREQDLDAITRRFNIIEMKKENRVLINALQLDSSILSNNQEMGVEEEQEKANLEESIEVMESSEVDEKEDWQGEEEQREGGSGEEW
jgi:hypothetical protein